MEISKYIGKKLHDIRCQKALSLEEVAFLASVNTAHLSQLERGIGNPTIGTINKICKSLDYQVKDLFADAPTSVADVRRSTTIDKIVIQLAQFAPEQQKEILNIVNSCKKISKKSKE